jgi:hypothetical protein
MGPNIVAWKARFFPCGGASAGGAAGAGAGAGGAPTPDIIMVPLNLEAALPAGFDRAVPHETQVVASSVFGFPQFGQ